MGREVISSFAVDGWDTAATWYTDANGRDSMTRVRDKRASFNFTAIEPVASNFFPVNAFSECFLGLPGNSHADKQAHGATVAVLFCM